MSWRLLFFSAIICQQISQLQTLVTSTQDQLLPKKKFAFKSRPKKAVTPAESDSPSPVPPALASGQQTSVPLFLEDENFVGFRDRQNEKLELAVSGAIIINYLMGIICTVCLNICYVSKCIQLKEN